jgi:1,4-alpha-glucan branching enzyme
MINFILEANFMGKNKPTLLWIDEEKKIISYKNGEYIFIFNFHPTSSYEGFEIPTHETAVYEVVMDTDEKTFGGFSRIAHDIKYHSAPLSLNKDYTGISIYLPCRTAIILKRISIL